MIHLNVSFAVVALICFLIAQILPFTTVNSGRWSWQNAGFIFLTLALFFGFIIVR